jgi:eukaryotic translation initiation factor 2C
MAAECIVRWVLQNQQSPKGLLFYRDGVAESQYKKIADFEVPQLDAAWARAKILLAERKIRTTLNSKCPSKIVVIVGKRHNVRFYPVNEDQSYFQKNRVRSSKSIIQTVGEGKSTRKVWSDTLNGNLKPGYVIDRVVTHPYAYDFFLQSHAAIEGTARSAHYYVLVNDPKWKPEKLHRVVSHFCSRPCFPTNLVLDSRPMLRLLGCHQRHLLLCSCLLRRSTV